MIAGWPNPSQDGKGQREESPDSHRRYLARAGGERATRLVTPGGCVARSAKAKREVAATESATENIPPVWFAPCGRPTAKPRARLHRSSAFGKGEKVG